GAVLELAGDLAGARFDGDRLDFAGVDEGDEVGVRHLIAVAALHQRGQEKHGDEGACDDPRQPTAERAARPGTAAAGLVEVRVAVALRLAGATLGGGIGLRAVLPAATRRGRWRRRR